MSCWNVGACGAFSVPASVCAVRFSVCLFVGVANSCMYLVLDSLFLSDGFLLKHIVKCRGSSGFPFCLARNLVQCLFTSLWIVLWWWLYVVVSLTFCGEG